MPELMPIAMPRPMTEPMPMNKSSMTISMAGEPITAIPGGRKSPSTLARHHSVRFLFLCHSRQVFFFSENHFLDYQTQHLSDRPMSPSLFKKTRSLSRGVLENITTLDELIASSSHNWAFYRIPPADLAILRLGAYELRHTKTPNRVVLNEAIELAKAYGSEKSTVFINGILDAIAHPHRSSPSLAPVSPSNSAGIASPRDENGSGSEDSTGAAAEKNSS